MRRWCEFRGRLCLLGSVFQGCDLGKCIVRCCLNINAADHLSIKVRILLGEDAPELPTDELDQYTLRRAVEVYQASDEKTLDHLRRIEQQRCLRFYYLNNWRYAPKMDVNSRLHPMLKSFDELDVHQGTIQSRRIGKRCKPSSLLLTHEQHT